MLTSIYSKSLRDRWVSTTASMALVGAFLVLAMAAYGQVGTDVYSQMPEALRSLMGIPDGADAATLAYTVVFGMMGALTLAGLALSMGASSVAGEERDGSIGVLLGNPRSRRQLLLSKMASMGTLAVGGGILLAAAGYLAPIALGVELGETQLLAAVLHLVGNALLWGMLATAVGAVTGNRSLASATAGGLMVISYFLVGLLPLAASMQGVVKGIPWYWFDGHQPLVHGVDLGYLGIQLAAIIALAAVAWWGVEARDLTRSTDAASVLTAALDRLREDERAARLLDRLQGDARVGSIFTKTAADGQALLVIVAVSMFLMMGLLIGGMYAALAGTLAQMSSSLPEAMLAFIGGGDMTTPEGFYQLETFGIMAPIAVILVAASVGGKALAGEERDRTIGLLLANPVPRRTIVLQKAAAMVVHATVVGAATFAGVLGGSLLGGLGISAANIAATTLHVTLLGTMFGAVALAVGAATGSVRTSTMVTIGVAGAAYFANALLSIGEDLARWAWVSPFEWYLGGDPLNTGVEWSSVALFVGLTLALVAAAVVLFDRRDLRHA